MCVGVYWTTHMQRRHAGNKLLFLCATALFPPAIIAQTSLEPARAVVLGIHRYTDVLGIDPLEYADKDAALFENLLRSGRLGTSFGSSGIVPLTNSGQTATRAGLRDTIGSALPGETLFVFISGRGLAYPGWDEGYIACSDTQAEKPQSTGVSVKELKNWIDGSPAARVWLFADVCRQSSRRLDNRINYRLADEFKKIVSKPFGAVLATSQKQQSEESGTLRSSLSDGHGVFSYFLVSGLYGRVSAGTKDADTDGDGRVSAKELVAYLLNRQRPPLTKAPQVPEAFGSLTRANAAVVVLGARRGAIRPRAEPVLLASLGAAALQFFPMQVDATAPQAAEAGCPALSNEEIANPVRAAEAFLGARPHSGSEEWNRRAYCLALAWESQGQRVVAAYGIGDQFPDDPAKLKESDFLAAARAFEAAYKLRSSDESLRVRQLFCDGRARAFSNATEARRLLGAALAVPTSGAEPTAEIHNAFGLTLFENGEHKSAIPHLEEAIRRAPTWAYPRHNLALAYTELGNYIAAEREYREAIRRTPYYPYLYYNLGLLLHRTGRNRAARQEYQLALTVSDEGIRKWRDAAARWGREGNAADADLASARAKAFRRNKGEIYNALGALLESQDALLQAAEEYQHALDMNPGLFVAAYNRASVIDRAAVRQTPGAVAAEALKLLRSVRDRNERFYPSRLLLGSLLLRQREFDEAEAEFRAVLQSGAAPVDAHAGLARALLGRRDFDGARIHAEQAIKQQTAAIRAQNPSSNRTPLAQAALYQVLADTFREMQDHSRACEFYRTAQQALKWNREGVDLRELSRKANECSR